MKKILLAIAVFAPSLVFAGGYNIPVPVSGPVIWPKATIKAVATTTATTTPKIQVSGCWSDYGEFISEKDLASKPVRQWPAFMFHPHSCGD